MIGRNEFQRWYIRPICYHGSASLSVHRGRCPVEVVILTWPWAASLGAEGLECGVRLTVWSWRKFLSQMMPTTAKACGQYVNSVLAVREAVERGYDEALLLDAGGAIAEGSGENLFIIRGDSLLTNDAESSILLGVTRDAVIKLTPALAYRFQIHTLPSHHRPSSAH